MLVPSSLSHPFGGIEERMLMPGAVTSGLSKSETGVGPAEENQAATSGRVP
jgi:hypothetical protein